MKDLNRYIKESLLDDEDDLVDDQSLFAMEWLSQNVGLAFAKGPLPGVVDRYFENNHGYINMVKNKPIVTFWDVPPADIIKKINTDKNIVNIGYPIKSQKDIDMFTGVTNISDQKLLKDLTIPIIDTKYTFDYLEFTNISKIQNITIDCRNTLKKITIWFTGRNPIKSFDDLTQLSCINNKNTNQITINLDNVFAKKLEKEMEVVKSDAKEPSQYLNEKYGSALDKIHKNIGSDNIVITLGRKAGAPLVRYSNDKWYYYNYFN